VCARVCPSDHLCEGACLLESVSEPVAIQAIEQFLMEYAFAHDLVDASTAPPNGKKVAVIGSGPAGLACADDLAKLGYGVTVFDLSLLPGGLLVNGVPAFKLERSIIQRRVEILQKRGVHFRLGVRLNEDVTLSQLRAEFDAVFLGFDSRAARPFNVPGADLRGVVQAVPFLLQKNSAIPLAAPTIDVSGKKVVVIGGGDTTLDCLRAAKRYGASEALGVYRREESDMRCTRRDYESAVEEGARFVFNAAPVAVLGGESGQAKALRLVRTKVGDVGKDGRRLFEVCPGTEFEVSADLIVTALGFDPLPCPHTGDFGQLAINEWGGIVVDEKQMTSVSGVFAGGDIVRGPGLILHTVRDARKAAEEIHAYCSPSS
jgi:glutamate synthase (NADPH/NADH) small chain